jgi:hypothetical protein
MEHVLLQDSKNLTALIQLMKLHEENVKRYTNELNEDTDVLMKQSLYIECEYSAISAPKITICPLSQSCFMGNTSVILVRECGHLFKREPFMAWAATHSTCPRCKARIV